MLSYFRISTIPLCFLQRGGREAEAETDAPCNGRLGGKAGSLLCVENGNLTQISGQQSSSLEMSAPSVLSPHAYQKEYPEMETKIYVGSVVCMPSMMTKCSWQPSMCLTLGD